MGRKRKSESISKDDVIDLADLSMAYGVDEDPPSVRESGVMGSDANAIPQPDPQNIRSKSGDTQFKLHFADTMSQATRSLDESARSIQIQNQQSSTGIDTRCTPCKYADLDCNLQRPICQKCQNLRTERIIVPCLYAQDLDQKAEIPYGQVSSLPVQPERQEVEVIDLGSDNGESPSGNNEEYEVEAILARRSKTKRKRIEYLVKWKGYPPDANTWEPVSNLDGAQAFIDGFEAAVASTSPPNRKIIAKRIKSNKSGELKQSPSLGLVVVPRNPKVLEHQTSRSIPENVRSIDACRLVPANDTYEYLVSWHGLAPNQTSWESETRFEGRKSLIQDYHLATCLHIPSDDTADVIDESGTDPKLISAGIQVIVCGSHLATGSSTMYTFYDKEKDTHLWIAASKLVSNEAQMAILLFVMRSKIMQGYLEPYKAIALNKALNRHGIPGPLQEVKVGSGVVANTTPEISAVLSHRLRIGSSTEYLVCWKNTHLNTWHPAEILSRLPGGILAATNYAKTLPKGFSLGQIPVTMPADKTNTTYQFVSSATTKQTDTTGVNSSTSQRRNVSYPNGHSQVHDDAPQRTSFIRCCVECKKAKLDCGGSTRCERCVTMNLPCVYAQSTTYERQAAEVRLGNHLSQQPSRDSLEVNSASRSGAGGRLLPPSAKSTSKAAWSRGSNNFRIQSNQTLTDNSAGNALSHTPIYKSSFVTAGKPRTVTGGTPPEHSSNDLRRVSETTETQGRPGSREMHNTTQSDEKWISDYVSRMIATLSEAEKARMRRGVAKNQHFMQTSMQQKIDPLSAYLRHIAKGELQDRKATHRDTVSQVSKGKARDLSYSNGQASHSSTHSTIQPLDHSKQASVRESTGGGSQGKKDRYYEELRDAFGSRKQSYAAQDKYLHVKKTDTQIRPLPNGPANYRNVASNVLLTMGKHPWLPGLNHHLRGLLDRGAGGRKLDSVSAQVRNAEDFMRYEAPTTMAQMTEANFRATLPIGGKFF